MLPLTLRGSSVTDEREVRIEDGSIQFGSDWPGVFFRGDTALGFGVHLGAALERLGKGETLDGIALAVLRGLQSDLMAASIEVGNDTRQFLKPARECLRRTSDVEADQRTIEGLRALAREVIERQKRRPEESIADWAKRLAEDTGKADD
jgi:hypothetical protein